ncbi:hypothetical protein P4O66_018897 [Electrophorus voltai]|uniref:Uncharacterized protein n=1 Tax=Electrophorus voltai TaxID=2609070 RepID=A0AAD9DK65_9TELE|nr:hypothetical protein P4O66_018897 [Electrophorus voltai]
MQKADIEGEEEKKDRQGREREREKRAPSINEEEQESVGGSSLTTAPHSSQLSDTSLIRLQRGRATRHRKLFSCSLISPVAAAESAPLLSYHLAPLSRESGVAQEFTPPLAMPPPPPPPPTPPVQLSSTVPALWAVKLRETAHAFGYRTQSVSHDGVDEMHNMKFWWRGELRCAKSRRMRGVSRASRANRKPGFSHVLPADVPCARFDQLAPSVLQAAVKFSALKTVSVARRRSVPPGLV